MKKFILTLALCSLSVFAFAEGLYVGSMKSHKYHKLDCRYARKIDEKNLIYFKTPEEAIKKGYYPCKVCRPPIFSEDEDGR